MQIDVHVHVHTCKYTYIASPTVCPVIKSEQVQNLITYMYQAPPTHQATPTLTHHALVEVVVLVREVSELAWGAVHVDKAGSIGGQEPLLPSSRDLGHVNVGGPNEVIVPHLVLVLQAEPDALTHRGKLVRKKSRGCL